VAHKYYCGVDLHSRTMYICVVGQDGVVLLHRSLPCDPVRFLLVVAPYREDLVVAVECVYSWYWLADLCAREGIAFGQGAKPCPARTHPASWAPTPGSDRPLIGHPSRSIVAMVVSTSSSSSLPLTRAPHILAPCFGTHTPAPLLNGTARGNRCVSRSWEQHSFPHPDTVARARSHNGSAGRTSSGRVPT